MKRQEAMKRLKRRLRCPIPLDGIDRQFPNCGCNLPPDKPEATAELQKIVSTANVPVTHCPPAKAPRSKHLTAWSKPPSSSVRYFGGEAMTTPSAIPSAFVWTKMEDEAGQSPERIVNRKELERQASNGTFCWGIGESKIEKVRSLVANERNPAVLFSRMRSPPHSRDNLLLVRACRPAPRAPPGAPAIPGGRRRFFLCVRLGVSIVLDNASVS